MRRGNRPIVGIRSLTVSTIPIGHNERYIQIYNNMSTIPIVHNERYNKMNDKNLNNGISLLGSNISTIKDKIKKSKYISKKEMIQLLDKQMEYLEMIEKSKVKNNIDWGF